MLAYPKVGKCTTPSSAIHVPMHFFVSIKKQVVFFVYSSGRPPPISFSYFLIKFLIKDDIKKDCEADPFITK